MKKIILTIVLTFLVSPVIWASESVFDPYFGNEGKVTHSIKDNKEDHGEVVATDSKGRIYVAGEAGIPDSIDFFVARFLTDGKLDPSFGKDGIAVQDLGGDDHVHGLVINSKGLISVVGFVKKGGESSFAVLSLKPDGSLNDSFGDKGFVKTDLSGAAEAHYAALMRDGSTVVGGFVDNHSDSDFVLVKYLPNGSLDSHFGDDGIVKLDWTKKDRVYGLTLTQSISQQKILVTGSAENAGTGEDCIVARFNLDGSRDKNFGFGGMSLVTFGRDQDVCSSIGTSKTGQIYVAGYKNNKSGDNADYAVARLYENGVIDNSFGENGFKIVDFDSGIDVAHALGLVTQDRLLVAGESEIKSSTGKQKQFSALLLNNKGELVESWGKSGKITVQFGQDKSELAMGLTPDKKGGTVIAGFAQENVALYKVLLTQPKKKKTH